MYKIIKLDANKIYKKDFKIDMDLDAIEKYSIREADNQYFRIIRNKLKDKNPEYIDYLEEIIMLDCSYNKIDCNGTYCKWLKEEHTKEKALIQERIDDLKINENSTKKTIKYKEKLDRELSEVDVKFHNKILNWRKSVLKSKEIEKNLEKLIDHGFYFNNIHYKLLGMSGNMARHGIKGFVADSIYDHILEYSTLGKIPTECQIPKYEAYRNLMFSSCKMLEYIPNIIIVKDYVVSINDVDIIYPVNGFKEYKPLDENGNEIIVKTPCKVMEHGKTDLSVNCFDGSGMHSKQFNKALKQYLKRKHGINYTPISYQIRMPFMKGLSTCVDFEKFFKENNITKIIDIDGVVHDLRKERIDCIWTESMWKGSKFFDSWIDYIERVKKYNHVFAITQWNKPSSMESNLTRFNYQYAQALKNLTGKDLISLSTKSKEWIEKVLSNPEEVINFLKLDSEENITNCFTAALYKSNDMIYEENVRESILKLLKKTVNEMKYGKILVEGKYYYAVPDFYLFLTYIANTSGCEVPITQCLHENQMYSKGLKGTHGSFRSPLLAENEINKVELVENEITEKYFSHFDNIVMENSISIQAMRMQTQDFDGDRIFLTKEKLIVDAIRTDLPLIMDLNEEKPPKVPYDKENLKTYHMRTLDCLIGEQSNKATVLQNKQNSGRYLEQLELLSIVVQKETDYVKAGVRWECGKYIESLTKKLPYFLIYRYENLKKEYRAMNIKRNRVSSSMRKSGKEQKEIDKKLQNEKDLELPVFKTKSPMNILCWDIEKWESGITYSFKNKDVKDRDQFEYEKVLKHDYVQSLFVNNIGKNNILIQFEKFLPSSSYPAYEYNFLESTFPFSASSLNKIGNIF